MDFKDPAAWQLLSAADDASVSGAAASQFCEDGTILLKCSKEQDWYALPLLGLMPDTDYFLKFSYLAKELAPSTDYVFESVGIFNAALEGADYKTNTDPNNIGYLYVVTPFGNMNSKNGLGTATNRKKAYSRDTRGALVGVWQEMRLHFHSGAAPDELALVLCIRAPEVYLDDFVLTAVPAPVSAPPEHSLPQVAEKPSQGTFLTRSAQTTLYTDCTAQDFADYCATLVNDGFSPAITNRLEDNLIAVYTKGNTLAHIAFYPANGTLRSTRQVMDALPEGAAGALACGEQPLLVQVNHLNGTGGGIGESYFIRLADGSFLLVDGGHSEYKFEQADILYRTLRRYQPTGKLRIAAWLFTHSHSDHIGGFNTFVERYHSEIEVEQLIYNFPNDAEISRSNSAKHLLYGYNSLSLFEMTVRHYLPKAKLSTPHTGYVYHIRNAVVTILHTMEDIFPAEVHEYRDLNDTGTVFQISFTDAAVAQKILITGDIAGRSCRDLMERYSEKMLASDFVQVIHHGISYGSEALYAKMRPTVALWPASDRRLQEVRFEAQNHYFFQQDSVREIVLSDFGTRAFALPYTPPTGRTGLAKITLPDQSHDMGNLMHYIGPRFDIEAESPRFWLEFSVSAEVRLATTAGGHRMTEYGLLLDDSVKEWCGTEGSLLVPAERWDARFAGQMIAYAPARGINAVTRYDSYKNYEDDLHRNAVFLCQPVVEGEINVQDQFCVRPYARFANEAGEELLYLGREVTETLMSALRAASVIWNPNDDPDLNAQKAYAKQMLEQMKQ